MVEKKGNELINSIFLSNFPSLKILRMQVQIDSLLANKDVGEIKAIDGRTLKIRSQHSALNTILLQGAGAIICKQWLYV